MVDLLTNSQARERICELCRMFWQLGWASGTGGGISLRIGDTIFMAPSGVEKERLQPADIFELDRRGRVKKAAPGQRLTACAPLFQAAYDHRDAAGFIKLNALRLRVAAKRDQRSATSQ